MKKTQDGVYIWTKEEFRHPRTDFICVLSEPQWEQSHRMNVFRFSPKELENVVKITMKLQKAKREHLEHNTVYIVVTWQHYSTFYNYLIPQNMNFDDGKGHFD